MFSCVVFVFLMTPHTPNSTRTYTIFPYTTLFRSGHLLKSSSLAPVSPETISTPRIASAQPAPAITTDVRGSARRTPRVPSESRNELVGLAAVGSVIPGRYAHLSCGRSEEHTSELQSLMRISYAVFCLKKKKQNILLNTHQLDSACT